MISRIPRLLFENILVPVADVLTKSVSNFAGHKSDQSYNSNATRVSTISDEEIEFYLNLKSAVLLLCLALCIAGFSVLMYFLYVLVFVPYNRVKRLGSIGYQNHEEGHLSKKDIANLVRRRRKVGDDLPPVFPNGWFRLVDSQQLEPGQVKQVTALGEHFAVFRSKSGKASILDAYCPHMGGNLAVGGIVKNDCLECPFHGWRFDGDGKCVAIPYSEKIPTFAKTKSWPCREVNKAIFVWFHCDGKEPEWEIPDISEISTGKFTYKGRVEHHANTHIQDVPENGSDLAHLSHLHVPHAMSGANLSTQYSSWWNFAEHIFKAQCIGPADEEPHISLFYLTHYLHVFKRFKLLSLNLNVYQIGPGIVHLHFDSPFGKGVFVQTLTPVEPLHLVLTHNLHASWSIPVWLGRIFLYLEAIQVDRDVMIWNNKTFEPRPKLLKEDSLIAKYRRWYSQFYTENSPRLTLKSEDGNGW
uniref:uncharacterized protein LOC100177386 isoform X2 n=1 Tax=Ciona intestinalis TaxID=7719 RepID=UPI000180D37A|nr:uncharacterized protein LOC100177386 isoform X2 [Ciona intestinalis]XP_026690558.1 uncharacterized protein LOC100177386 isoform X2 [Ciona intestinalis]|eukprot:XP_018667711.1 uncharacterized protein LOC100177386 isoform X2 [Ciona intestinalis]